jgi:hypothetical protein
MASVGLMTLVLAHSAMAGTYLMRTCNVPGAPRTTTAPWQWSAGGGTFANDDCANGGGFGLNVGTMTSGYVSGVGVGTDGTIGIRRVRLWLVARLAGTGSSLYAVTQYGTAASAAPAMGLFNPPGGETLTTPWVSPEFPADTAIFQVYLNCGFDAGFGVGCTPNSTTALDIKGAEVTLEENLRPTASIDGGELMTDSAQAGVRGLAYTANDAGSGVARVTAVVGKTVAGTLDFAGDCAYAALAACARARNGTLAVDTRKIPDGIYPVSLTVTDAAGNQQTVQAATAIRVANNAAGSAAPAADGLLGNARLTASFAANRRSMLTVGYGRRVVIRGRLRGSDRVPIGGASIDVEERSSGGARTINAAVTT